MPSLAISCRLGLLYYALKITLLVFDYLGFDKYQEASLLKEHNLWEVAVMKQLNTGKYWTWDIKNISNIKKIIKNIFREASITGNLHDLEFGYKFQSLVKKKQTQKQIVLISKCFDSCHRCHHKKAVHKYYEHFIFNVAQKSTWEISSEYYFYKVP